jgi:hypothetical protein
VGHKTIAVKALLADGFERIIFFGDALFEDGNDAALREHVEKWPDVTACPLEAVQVNSWKNTLDQLSLRHFINDLMASRK